MNTFRSQPKLLLLLCLSLTMHSLSAQLLPSFNEAFPHTEAEAAAAAMLPGGDSNHWPQGQAAGEGELLPAPHFSDVSGFYSEAFSLSLSCEDANADIVYTLDGSEPSIENLGGSSYQYRNQYEEFYWHNPGPLLTQSYTSLSYSGPIPISDRTHEANKLASITSTYNQDPNYIPNYNIPKASVVRARCYSNGSAGKVTTHTYFVSTEGSFDHQLPILSLSVNEDEFFDYNKGIYVAGVDFDSWRAANPFAFPNGGTQANYRRRGIETEKVGHLQYFVNTEEVLSQGVGLRMHGGWSRAHCVKSIRVYGRSAYDEQSSLDYPLFSTSDDASYKRVFFRNSGNDYNSTYLRDASIQAAVRHLRFDTQNHQPAVVYLNGEYYGMLNMRERYDKHYIKRNYGIDEEELDLLTSNAEINEGSNSNFLQLRSYISSNDLSDPTHYQYVIERLDPDNFMDYHIAQIYIDNTDWPGNNIKFFRKQTAGYESDAPYGQDGRWRWLMYDTDFGLNMYGSDNHANNTLAFATAPNGPGWPNPPWSTVILRRLLENEGFRHEFINRFADLMNTAFLPDRMNAIIDSLADAIAPELPAHSARWNRLNSWQSGIAAMKSFTNQRPPFQRNHILNQFGLTGTLELSLEVSDSEHGHIRVNSIEVKTGTPGIPEEAYPWQGIYYRNVPMSFSAVPAPGYTFLGWEGDTEAEGASFTQAYASGEVYLKALFAKDESANSEELSLHYWHFNDLDGEVTLIPADTGAVGDGIITYPGSGDGYMDDVNDGSPIKLLFGESPGSALRVRNPSDSRHLLIEASTEAYANISINYAARRTSNGATKQILSYRTEPSGSWILLDSIDIGTDYAFYSFDLSQVDAVNDNEHFALRIDFGGENADGPSGNNRLDNLSINGTAAGEIALDYLPLAQQDFSFTDWNSSNPAGTYPGFMRFHWSENPSDSLFDVHADATGLYDCGYALSNRPRITGLGEDGFSFLSTGNPQHNDCSSSEASPTRYVGSASIALNTQGVSAAEMTWIAGLQSVGARQFAVRLQYRTSGSGPYSDLGLPVTYSSADKMAGHEAHFEIELPAMLLGQPQLQLRFVYYQEEGDSGNRPAIRIDDVHIGATEFGTVCTASGGVLEAPANRSFCVGTGSFQGIPVTATGASGSLQRWGLIAANGDIIATRTNNSLFNLDSYPPGNYSIRHIRFESDVDNLGSISNVSQVGQLNGCYGLSSNAINVFLRAEPLPGILSAVGPTSFCANQSQQVLLTLSASGHTGQFGLYGVVSSPGQDVVASSASGSINLSGLAIGSYLGAHLSYEQGVSLAGLSNASDLEGCYALSNLIPINIVACGGLELRADPNPTHGPSRISFSSAGSDFGLLEVWDMSGRRVASLWQGQLEPGTEYYSDFDATGHPPGVYLIRLSSANAVEVYKLVIGL